MDTIRRYETIAPQAFRIGDIVEAQLSLVVIPMRGGKFKMITVLRAITLIEERSKVSRSEDANKLPDELNLGQNSQTQDQVSKQSRTP